MSKIAKLILFMPANNARVIIFYNETHYYLFQKNRVLKNFAKFTGKHLGKSLFFNKVAGLRPVTLF